MKTPTLFVCARVFPCFLRKTKRDGRRRLDASTATLRVSEVEVGHDAVSVCE